ITVFASNLSAASFNAASVLALSEPEISISNTLPWRTLATPSTPSDFSAPSMALPCGSRMPVLSVTVTRAFIFLAQYLERHPEVLGRSPSLEGRHGVSYLHPSRLAEDRPHLRVTERLQTGF